MCYRIMHTVTETCDIHLHMKYETHTYLNSKIFSTHRSHSHIDILPLMFYWNCYVKTSRSYDYGIHTFVTKAYSNHGYLKQHIFTYCACGGIPKFQSFDKAESNSQFCGKYICNNRIRIWVSIICKLSGTPD
jgi:hypothetical protein